MTMLLKSWLLSVRSFEYEVMGHEDQVIWRRMLWNKPDERIGWFIGLGYFCCLASVLQQMAQA